MTCTPSVMTNCLPVTGVSRDVPRMLDGLRPPPWRFTRDRRSQLGFACFWAFAVAVDVAAAVWVHGRDTHRGDQWDWSDWLEAIIFALGFSIGATTLAWSSAATLVARVVRRGTAANGQGRPERTMLVRRARRG